MKIKKLSKSLLSILSKLFLLPLFIIYKFQNIFFKNERFYSDCAQLVSGIPGTIGDYIRREYYIFTLRKCSNDCHIGYRTIFSHPDAEIGRGVYIGINCMIGTVTIEDDVLIGSNVDILDGAEQHSCERLDIPIRFQDRRIVRKVIGRDCWIGNSAVVMANIGSGCVVGAGSVLVHDIEDYSIAVGNPARVIKKRSASVQPL